MIVLRLILFLWREFWKSPVARGIALGLLLAAGVAYGLWYTYHRGYTRGYALADAKGKQQLAELQASWTRQIAAADARASATIAAWQDASNKLQQQYLQEKAKADATSKQIDQQLAQSPGADAPLPPYLAHAAGVLYGHPTHTGTAH